MTVVTGVLALGFALIHLLIGKLAFLHAIHGSDHHILAFAQSSAAGIHHCSWDTQSIDDIGLGAMHMADKGFTKGWGLGRHVLGSNYFHYIQDPWGSFAEYSCDIDYIPATQPWEAQGRSERHRDLDDPDVAHEPVLQGVRELLVGRSAHGRQRPEAGHHRPEDSFYLWGPEPPEDFTTNREA